MTHRIAVIAGDGIGTEVMPEGLRVLEAAATKFGIALQLDTFDWACWPYYERHGRMLPDDWKQTIGGHDAIFFGAVGWPAKIPDHVSLWGSLLKFRREFDQYINLRPARLFDGVPCPLAGRKAGAMCHANWGAAGNASAWRRRATGSRRSRRSIQAASQGPSSRISSAARNS